MSNYLRVRSARGPPLKLCGSAAEKIYGDRSAAFLFGAERDGTRKKLTATRQKNYRKKLSVRRLI